MEVSLSGTLRNIDLLRGSLTLMRTCGRIHTGKVALYRDTGSVEPGSRPFFGSVSGSEIQILDIALAKDTFSLL